MNTVNKVVPKRRFGRTNLAMPVFSCGGMRYQQSWKDLAPEDMEADSQKNLEACIRRALELGINHIETARGYGSSEWQLGRFLPDLPRDEMIVQTKIGPKESGAEFLEVFETSMANLRLDYIDLLGVHGINTRDLLEQVLKPDGMWPALRALQREGRVRHIGFSTHGPADVIVAAIESGAFDYVNLHWYYVNPFTWPAVEVATRQDVGVFIISPNDKGGKLYAPSEKMKALCAPLTPMQFNDCYCLARPDVHTLSLGAARPSDFDEHVDALPKIESHPGLVGEIEQRLQSALVARHGEAWMRHWQTAVPDWTRVPGHVNILEILRLWTYGQGLDLIEWAKMRYNLLGQGDHWFPGQNAANADVTAIKTVLGEHPLRSEIVETLRAAHAAFFEAPVKRASESE